MTKIVGVCMVLLASTGIGVSMSIDLKQRIRDLKYIKKLMLMLRGEIHYTKAPLPEALANIGIRLEGPFQKFVCQVSDELEQYRGQTFQDIWKERVKSDLKDTRLTKEDKQQLMQMGDNFGYLDGEMQIGTIDLYLEQLELDVKQLEGTVHTKTRIYNCLGIMGGLVLVIVMI